MRCVIRYTLRLLRFVHGLERLVLGEVPFAWRRKRMRARGRKIEIAAEREQRVADRLGIEPPARKTREQLVRGIVRHALPASRALAS